jgi:rubrerythrin
MTTDFDAISDILKKAFQVEVDGFTFYSMAVEAATKPAVRKLFERLARDETEHKAYIMAVMRRYEEHGASSFHFDRRDPDLGEFSSEIFTEDFKEQALGELSELGALSIAIQLESNAVSFFDTAANKASDPQISGFYRFLADWEGSHLRTVQHLYDNVRVDHWPEKNG